MAVIKYMSLLTTCSVFAALLSIIWQAFLSLKELNKVTSLLTGLLAIESSFKRPLDVPPPKVAIGYGACTDLLINATDFLNYTAEYVEDINPKYLLDNIKDERELLKSFAYYFQSGAAAERVISNSELFNNLLNIAKTKHNENIRLFIGGNAPLMGIRFFMEGAKVLLGARMSERLRRLIPKEIEITGNSVNEDDMHIILEYKSGDKWGPFTAPRANRYIIHNDQNNPYLTSLEEFSDAVKDFQPRLIVISGLQMMDSYKFDTGVREARLSKLRQQLSDQNPSVLQHFEMASCIETLFLLSLRKEVLPYIDSIGMNEQELDNLSHLLEFEVPTLASDWNPRVATTLDQMRKVFKILSNDFYKNVKNDSKMRLLTRIHVHTLAYQALLIVKNSQWKNTNIAAAKAALTAHRYVCQTSMVNPEAASLILDDSFATSATEAAERKTFNSQNPVPCWNEVIELNDQKSIEVEICVAPVLVCRIAKKTAGAGDNISAAGLIQQL